MRCGSQIIRRAWFRLLTVAIATGIAATPSVRAHPDSFPDRTDGLIGRDDRAPMAGANAPPFTAVWFDPVSGSTASRTLDSLLEGRPLVLAFGSYT